MGLVPSPGKSNESVQESFPRGVTQDVLNPPNNELQIHMWSAVSHGSLLENQGWRILFGGLVRQAPSASHAPKSQTPRRKAGVRYEPWCLSEQFRHSETTLFWQKWWEPPQIQVTGPLAKGQALWVGWEEDQGINLSWYFKILSCQIFVTFSLWISKQKLEVKQLPKTNKQRAVKLGFKIPNCSPSLLPCCGLHPFTLTPQPASTLLPCTLTILLYHLQHFL